MRKARQQKRKRNFDYDPAGRGPCQIGDGYQCQGIATRECDNCGAWVCHVHARKKSWVQYPTQRWVCAQCMVERDE